MSEPIEVVSTVSALRGGELTPAAHAADVCERIERLDGDIHAFVDEPARVDRLATAAARLADAYAETAAAQRPALYGLQVGVKDIIHVDGLPTRGGSALPVEVLAGRQATIVSRLLGAGAIVTGKTATAEFAHRVPGPTRNPHAYDHTPGGSSSGSAAAVAAGMVPVALGTQTVGSVIRPAAFCGVVGFKPTYRRIPTDGILYNAPTFDTLGMFTADVAGAAVVASIVCDGWRPGRVESGRRPVLGVPARQYLEQAEPAAAAAFERQVERLTGAGFDVRHTDFLADIKEINERHALINSAELAESHAQWFGRYEHLYSAATAEAIRLGPTVARGLLAAAYEAHRAFRDVVEVSMADSGVDVWISPAATGPAPASLASTGNATMNLPWTHGGLPAITVPAGRVDGGAGVPLPVGLQCAARFGADEELLGWAGPIARVMNAT